VPDRASHPGAPTEPRTPNPGLARTLNPRLAPCAPDPGPGACHGGNTGDSTAPKRPSRTGAPDNRGQTRGHPRPDRPTAPDGPPRGAQGGGSPGWAPRHRGSVRHRPGGRSERLVDRGHVRPPMAPESWPRLAVSPRGVRREDARACRSAPVRRQTGPLRRQITPFIVLYPPYVAVSPPCVSPRLTGGEDTGPLPRKESWLLEPLPPDIGCVSVDGTMRQPTRGRGVRLRPLSDSLY